MLDLRRRERSPARSGQTSRHDKEPRPRRAYAEEAGELQETAEAVTP
ncbi:hypothetical protein HMPREF9061_00865 [Actinomyces sp. oral taxon 181 str. F0379]|nr:hypothetical protein HMPREF9061_00865 [Actinomyces sp. oral taxon 181 str. F0379]